MLTTERNDEVTLHFREVPLSVRVHRGTTEPHARHHTAWQVQNGLHQHGGQSDAREQRPLEVMFEDLYVAPGGGIFSLNHLRFLFAQIRLLF